MELNNFLSTYDYQNDWNSRIRSGKKVERMIARQHGLLENENVRGTDLYSAKSGVRVEIKHIAAKTILHKWVDGVAHPHSNYFTVTQGKNVNGWEMRPGGVFRTCLDDPDALFVVHCPYKFKRNCYVTGDECVTINPRTYYFRAYQLMAELYKFIKTRAYALQWKGHKLETLLLIQFTDLAHIAMTEDEFRKCLDEPSKCRGFPREVTLKWFQEIASFYSVPLLRASAIGAKVEKVLKNDKNIIWKSSNFRWS